MAKSEQTRTEEVGRLSQQLEESHNQLKAAQEAHLEEVASLSQRFRGVRRQLGLERKRARRLANGQLGRMSSISARFSSSYLMHNELLAVWRIHPWTRSTIALVGRSLMGQMFEIIPVEGRQGQASPEERRKCLEYFYPRERTWTNIKDFLSVPAKLFTTAIMLKLFGQAAWEQVRNGFGQVVTFDLIFGKVKPNFNSEGQFEAPAWTQYGKGGSVNFENVNDIIYFVIPDLDGFMTGASDIESLTSTTLASDLLSALANQALIENIGSPDGIFKVERDLDDEPYSDLEAQIEDLYRGPVNFGRSMIISEGLVDYVPFDRERDMQWGESREFHRQEVSATTGVSAGQLGQSEGLSRSNLMELRRQFWDTTIQPLTALIESGVNEQAFQRDLQIYDWIFRFRSPQFQTEGERTYNAIRRVSYAISTPGEEARRMGFPTDFPGANLRMMPANMRLLGEEPLQDLGPPAWGTHPLQGRPRTEGQEGSKPVFEKQREELSNWYRICKAMGREGAFPVTDRVFEPRYLSRELVEWGQDQLAKAKSLEEIEEIFNDLFCVFQ